LINYGKEVWDRCLKSIRLSPFDERGSTLKVLIKVELDIVLGLVELLDPTMTGLIWVSLVNLVQGFPVFPSLVFTVFLCGLQ
jgi:hypothetical protein